MGALSDLFILRHENVNNPNFKTLSKRKINDNRFRSPRPTKDFEINQFGHQQQP